MKEHFKIKFKSFSKTHGLDGAIVVIYSETLITLYGGAFLFELGLYYLIPPLLFIPVSLFSILPLYIVLKNLLKGSLNKI